ncbi:MAG: ATP-binding cassette domain-containing protein [Bdellovibrionales bacterium]|nr:ATP-binding cassette domain-containing protein [Bdellovibrionales bacterium]
MIHLKGVGKSFDGRCIFSDVHLHVPRGGSAAIVGPSGSGKTVLLKTIAGLHHADQGQVTIESAELGMLFQRNALFNSLTVRENLLFPLKERKGIDGSEAIDLAKKYLEWVGLSGTDLLSPDELSGGMQKRLGIARALIVQPEVVLYDDPTAGLDPITSRLIAELIRKLQAQSGTTVIAVTNDMHRAYQLGDQIFLMAQGKLTAGGTAEQVKKSQNPALRQFVNGLQEGPLQ